MDLDEYPLRDVLGIFAPTYVSMDKIVYRSLPAPDEGIERLDIAAIKPRDQLLIRDQNVLPTSHKVTKRIRAIPLLRRIRGDSCFCDEKPCRKVLKKQQFLENHLN